MNAAGHEIESLYLSGGHVKNEVFIGLLANACNLPVHLPSSHSNSVALGSAMLAAAAAQDSEKGPILSQAEACQRNVQAAPRMWSIMQQLAGQTRLVKPSANKDEAKLHDAKYKVFQLMILHQKQYKAAMEGCC